MDFEAQEYSKYSNYETTGVKFPYVLLEDPVDILAVLIDGLTPGDMQLIVKVDGEYREVARIKKSLLTLHDILKIRPFKIGTENGTIEITNMEQLIESDIKWT